MKKKEKKKQETDDEEGKKGNKMYKYRDEKERRGESSS